MEPPRNENDCVVHPSAIPLPLSPIVSGALGSVVVGAPHGQGPVAPPTLGTIGNPDSAPPQIEEKGGEIFLSEHGVFNEHQNGESALIANMQARCAELEQALQAKDLQLQAQRVESAQNAAAQLEDRLTKVVALLIRFGTTEESVPDKMPEFIRVGIEAIRASSQPLVQEHDRLRHEHELLLKRLQTVTPQLAELASLRDRASQLAMERDTAVAATHAAREQLARESARADQQEALAAHARNAAQQASHTLEMHRGETDDLREQVTTLQAALDEMSASQRTDLEYRTAHLQRKLDAACLAQETATNSLATAQSRIEDLEGILTDKNQTVRDLQMEVHTLNHHIQHKLKEISSNHELDRQLIANLLVQFLTNESRQEEILRVLSGMLNFTPEQLGAVGLGPKIRPAGARSPHPSTGDLRTASPGNAPSQFHQSMSDKWISFLLRESSGGSTQESTDQSNG